MMSQPSENETNPSPAEPAQSQLPPARERAEILVDQFNQQVARWANSLGDGLQRIWARTREEGEDIWAEAQDIRHRARNGSSS